VSSLYPGPRDPDFGIFVKDVVDALADLGWETERAVVRHRGGSRLKHLRLAWEARALARRFRPDVVYAHLLFPGGAAGALAAGAVEAPLVLHAHGIDVRNIGTVPGVRAVTRRSVRRAEAVLVASDFMRRELVAKLPELAGRVSVVPYGVDLERFRGGPPEAARTRVGWEGEPPFFLCVGGLAERKNVVRLADAFERLGRGSLAFVGDGPLRPRLEGRPGVRVVGRVPHAEVVSWLSASDVLCQPSLVEPFGQAILEAMACERSVVATRVGGPPEFVPLEAGVLVEPDSSDSIEAGLRAAAELPTPNTAARAAAARYDLRIQAQKVSELLEGARQNDSDGKPHARARPPDRDG
jgi:glycosyltransferase involved in cell wall biosynthesis